jgi:arabinoxylan arabinofuranohydrolase
MNKFKKSTFFSCIYIVILFWFCNIGIMANNPIITNESVCDPHIRIFNNKAYLFSSHDYSNTSKGYKMVDWQLWSSLDLIKWKKEAILKPEDTYIGQSSNCWATDGAFRNGKYYWYFSNHNINTGVAVSKNGAGGPYIDVLNKPLLSETLTPTEEYDPTIFIDDDNTPYILFGYKKGYYIAKLNDDMISLAETPKLITINDGWTDDANFLHKHNGIYYLNTHGTVSRSKNRYATATNIYGPYTGKCWGSENYLEKYLDHLTFFSWKNQDYYAFGSLSKDSTGKPNYYYRYTKIGICNYKDNGEIALDTVVSKSSLGVGQYDAKNIIQAEWYFEASNGIKKVENGTGFELENIRNNNFICFPNIRNLNNDGVVRLKYSSANLKGCKMEIRQDNYSGKLLGSYSIPYTGGWNNNKTKDFRLKATGNTMNLCFVFKGKGTELLRLDWVKFLSCN